MRIVFIGPPGAGKGTQAARLAAHLGVPHLSTGEMLRQARAERSPLGEMVKGYLDAGQLVPDSVIVRIVGERLARRDCAVGCVLDGFPRTLAQGESLDKLLAAEDAHLDAVLQVVVPDHELRRRLLGRGRDDDTPEVVERRIRDYHALSAPLIDYYRDRSLRREIEGVGAPDEVFGRILAAIDVPAARLHRDTVE